MSNSEDRRQEQAREESLVIIGHISFDIFHLSFYF
jgi:hypothetical protein